MRTFSKPKKMKKFEPGKSTAQERAKVQAALRRKYPQMYEEGWGSPRKREKTARTSSIEAALRQAGISPDELPSDVDRRKRGK